MIAVSVTTGTTVSVLNVRGAVPDSGGAAVTVTCDAGLAVVGGGVSIDPNHGIEQGSYPSAANAWVGSVFGDTGTPFTVYALCAPAASTQ